MDAPDYTRFWAENLEKFLKISEIFFKHKTAGRSERPAGRIRVIQLAVSPDVLCVWRNTSVKA